MSSAVAAVLVAALASHGNSAWEDLPTGDLAVEVRVSGRIVVSECCVQLCPAQELNLPSPARCIDVVPHEGVSPALAEAACAVVSGTFQRYSSEFVGIGNLTSEIGLLQARSATSCDGG